MYRYKRLTPEEAEALDSLGIEVYPCSGVTPGADGTVSSKHQWMHCPIPEHARDLPWWIEVEE